MLASNNTDGDISLRHQPTTKNIPGSVGIMRHWDNTKRGISFRQWFHHQ
jgi:hypothetical protein